MIVIMKNKLRKSKFDNNNNQFLKVKKYFNTIKPNSIC